MGTHPIFESDFDCLTELMTEAHEFKLVVLGTGGVGKSALTVQFHQKVFVQEYDPTLEDNYVKRHDVDGVTYKLSILDTAGQDEFSAFREVYYRSGDGFILVCSFGDEPSLREIRKFYTDVRRIREGQGNIPMIIAANKCDFDSSQRKFSEDAVINLAQELNCKYFFTSAKLDKNVDQGKSHKLAPRLYISIVEVASSPAMRFIS